MTELALTIENENPRQRIHAQVRRIRIVGHAPDDSHVVMQFTDPAPCRAVEAPPGFAETHALADGFDCGGLDVLTMSSAAKDDPSARETWNNWLSASIIGDPCPTIHVNFRGAEAAWKPGQAALQALPEQIEPLLAALVEFSFYESELRKLEREIAAAWPDLEVDKLLAYEVTPADLERNEVVGRRMALTLERRIRHARLEPHLYEPGAQLSSPAQNLGEQLREKARVEERLEIVDGQLEVFEHIYEMSSQRIGEFRASRQEQTLEWIIIIILAAESLLLLADLLWTLEV